LSHSSPVPRQEPFRRRKTGKKIRRLAPMTAGSTHVGATSKKDANLFGVDKNSETLIYLASTKFDA